MAHSEVDTTSQTPTNSGVDTTQQVTSQTPTTRPKNPKRVAAGKAIAEKTRQAREQQKKALAEAQLIIANQKIPKKDEPPVTAPVASESTRNVLTTTQWLSVISIVVSLGGIYYKREELKALFAKKTPQAPPPSPVDVSKKPPQALPQSPVDVGPQTVVPRRKRGIHPMD